jgi:hypothetical protein
MQVRVPRDVNDDSMSGARWKVDGTVRIRTQNLQTA